MAQDNTGGDAPAKPATPVAPPAVRPASSLAREVTGTPRKFIVPPHVTKHPNPVGRPRKPRG